MATDKELLNLYLSNGRKTDKVAKILKGELAGRTIRRRLAKAYPGYNRKNFDPNTTKLASEIINDPRPIASGYKESPVIQTRHKLKGKRFVFTSAQNNTYIHEDFFEALTSFCIHNDAQLVVSKFSYNKSGFQNSTKGDDGLWYDDRLAPFFLNQSAEVAEDLIWCGELDILPTAERPLQGFETYAQGSSAIIPHTKVQMTSLPRVKGEDPRFLYSTGAVTLRNYIQKKAGQKADFHHVFGALYVEIDEQGDWFARQLIADSSGTFHDLTNKYTANKIYTKQDVVAINYGDIHIEKMDDQVYDAAFGEEKSSMLETLNPMYQFIHDLSDFSARNHHNIKDPFFLARMHFSDSSNVESDLDDAARFLEYITRKSRIAVVVESNHDQAYQRWLREADIRQDAENAEFYHRSNAEIYKNIREGNDEFNVFEWALTQKRDLTNVIFLKEDDSFVICNDEEQEHEHGRIKGGIECGMHGHRGPNGSRGSANNIRFVGRRCNLGHSHSAGIIDGAYIAGVSGKLDMDYNKGPSSWSHSHIVTYPNGKRTIITMKRGKWKA